jgi:hypothetical protein
MPNPQPKLPLTLKAIVDPSSEPLLPQLVLLLSLRLLVPRLITRMLPTLVEDQWLT